MVARRPTSPSIGRARPRRQDESAQLARQTIETTNQSIDHQSIHKHQFRLCNLLEQIPVQKINQNKSKNPHRTSYRGLNIKANNTSTRRQSNHSRSEDRNAKRLNIWFQALQRNSSGNDRNSGIVKFINIKTLSSVLSWYLVLRNVDSCFLTSSCVADARRLCRSSPISTIPNDPNDLFKN
jgi:hypothetical protein